MPLAAGDHPVAFFVDQPLFFGFQNRHEAAAGHDLRTLNTPNLKESRCQVHQVHEIVDHATARFSGPPNRQRDLHAEVVQVAFAARKTGRAMIAADDHDRFVQFAHRLKPLEYQAKRSVERLHLAEVIGKILPHLVHVRQKLRQPALEIVRLDAPQILAGAFCPLAMHERRAKPVAERLVTLAGVEERIEIAHHLIVEQLLGRLHRHAIGHALGCHLRKPIEPVAAFLVAKLARAIRGIPRCAGRPDLVRLADVITGIAQHQRKRRDHRIPLGSLQDRAQAGAEKVLPGK